MREQRQAWWSAAVVAMALALGATSAAAQVCGDADANGSVTVTDGVQALRAAAQLPSSCGNACDVDGSGAITLTDGVNVLRKAAGLGGADGCTGTGQSLEQIVGQVASQINVGLGFIPGGGVQSAFVGDCDNVGEGTFEITGDGRDSTVVYTNCRFGTSTLRGTISSVDGTARFERFEFSDTATGVTIRYQGALTTIVNSDTGTVTFDGALTVFSSVFGETTFIYRNLVRALDGVILAGQVLTALAAQGSQGVDTVEITYNGTDLVDVRVTFDDARVEDYVLDRTTGTLTPAAAARAAIRPAAVALATAAPDPSDDDTAGGVGWIRTRCS